jgi:hypothetical protein
VCHFRRFEDRLLPPGLSSVTYTIFDNTSFPEPVEAKVTVIYHLSGLGVSDAGNLGSGDAGNLIRVYPNPASDRITIETGKARPGNYTLMIYSSQGTLVQKTNLHIRENKLTIDVNQLLPGFYYGRLFSEQGAGVAFRFQVAR